MEAVATGLDADVDHRAGLPAEFRAGILLGLEFVDGVDGQHGSGVAGGHDRIHHALRHPWIVAVDAFHQVEVIVRAQTVGSFVSSRSCRRTW